MGTATYPSTPSSSPPPQVVCHAGEEEEEEEENRNLERPLQEVTVAKTPELVNQSLQELDEYLNSVPPELKREWMEAKRRAPSLVGNDHKLQFLRFENFHVELAALRLLRYWSIRVELFDSPRAFEPMTMEGAMRDDVATLSYGTIVYTQAYDERGCGILYERFDRNFELYQDAHLEWSLSNAKSENGDEGSLSAQNNNNDKHSPSKRKSTRAFQSLVWRSIMRVAWYMFHVAMQDEKVRQNGAVYLSRPRPFSLLTLWRVLNSERRQGTIFIDMLRGCLPIRVRAFHMCQPAPIYRLLMACKYKPRSKGPFLETTELFLHHGSSQRVLRRLTTEYGFPLSSVPAEWGGTLSHNHAKWLAQRRNQEEKKQDSRLGNQQALVSAMENVSATAGA